MSEESFCSSCPFTKTTADSSEHIILHVDVLIRGLTLEFVWLFPGTSNGFLMPDLSSHPEESQSQLLQ